MNSTTSTPSDNDPNPNSNRPESDRPQLRWDPSVTDEMKFVTFFSEPPSDPLWTEELQRLQSTRAGHVLPEQLDEAGLTSVAYTLYAYLIRRGVQGTWPGVSEFAVKLHVKKHAIIRAIRTLQKRNMVRLTRNPEEANEYRMIAPAEWKVPEEKQQA